MTLKEKLFNTVFDNAWEYRHKNTIPELEKIADEFAVNFANWLILKCDYQRHGIFEYLGEEYTNKELLEIYKKEKGL